MNLVGSKVKLFLINSLSAEGEIEHWGEDNVILLSNGRKLVVNNPQQNIIMYYFLSNEAQATKKEKFWEVPEPQPDNNIKDLNLKIKKLADLKVMSAEAQREQIRKELTTFRPINTDLLGKYGTPSFINSQHSASQEINDGNAIDIGELSKMSRKATE
jgi:hypothetical protein